MKISISVAVRLPRGIAAHVTDERSKELILKTGKFIASERGWNGPGLYAHLNRVDPVKNQGKGHEVVYFSYAGLKLNQMGQPAELSDAAWNKLRNKDSDTIDRVLVKLGYDGEIDHSIIRVFPRSTPKLVPQETV